MGEMWAAKQGGSVPGEPGGIPGPARHPRQPHLGEQGLPPSMTRTPAEQDVAEDGLFFVSE